VAEATFAGEPVQRIVPTARIGSIEIRNRMPADPDHGCPSRRISSQCDRVRTFFVQDGDVLVGWRKLGLAYLEPLAEQHRSSSRAQQLVWLAVAGPEDFEWNCRGVTGPRGIQQNPSKARWAGVATTAPPRPQPERPSVEFHRGAEVGRSDEFENTAACEGCRLVVGLQSRPARVTCVLPDDD